MKLLATKEKGRTKKGEVMWSVQLDDGKWYDAYKQAADYEIRTKGDYTWAVPIGTPQGGGQSEQKQQATEERSLSIERQNALRHTAVLAAAFINARPSLDTQAVDMIVRHYFDLFYTLIREGGKKDG